MSETKEKNLGLLSDEALANIVEKETEDTSTELSFEGRIAFQELARRSGRYS